jgi:RHS repeat-associated protein
MMGILAWFMATPVLATSPETIKYYYANGQQVSMRKNGVVTYLHNDHLGSTSLATDGSGAQVSRMLYYPYGEERYQDGILPTDYTYAGQRVDNYIDMIEVGTRWYDARLGRWISADTIVPDLTNPQSLDRFTYVYNNPLKYIDLQGHFPWLVVPVLVVVTVVCTRSTVDPEVEYINTLRETASSDVDALVTMFRTDKIAGDTVLERFGRILHHTRKIPGLYTGGGFGETGFDQQFQDGYLYEQYWGGGTAQIGHFLTAAAFGSFATQFPRGEDFLVTLAAGHEIRGDQGAPISWFWQFLSVTPEAQQLFWQAIEADAAGDYALRDEYLMQIFVIGDDYPIKNRQGNSLEDLRLTVRGWRFGQMVANGEFASNEEAAQWLEENLK